MTNPAVEANARLRGYVAVVLALPLAAELVTGLRHKQVLPAQALIPPVLLKRGSAAAAKPGATTTLESIARFDIRFRWLIVAIWILGALAAA